MPFGFCQSWCYIYKETEPVRNILFLFVINI